MKPVVDELETELGDKILFIRLNIQEDVGRELAPVYHFEFTPTFIYFDKNGVELWRDVGGLDPQRVRDSLK
jgi:thioredoxin-related protein